MGPEAVAGAVAVADHLALAHVLALGDGEAPLVRVAGREATAVVDACVVPVAAAGRLGLGEEEGAGGRRVERRPGGARDVDPGVELVAAVDRARPERRDDRSVD